VADDDKTPKRNRWTPEGGSGGSGVPRPRFSPWLALPLLLIAVLIFNSWLGNASTVTLDYSDFRQARRGRRHRRHALDRLVRHLRLRS
jgi:hypothetical protein